MYDFAEICGNYDKRYGTRRWQTLEAAAAHFGYNYKAHDSLEDARATLYIRNRIKREKEILDELTAPYQTVKGEQILGKMIPYLQCENDTSFISETTPNFSAIQDG